jgi:hypothetical protein
MKQVHQFSERLFVSTRQAARHYQASLPALKVWIRDGWLVAFKTPQGYCRKEREELRRSLRQYGIFLCTISAPYICILISDADADLSIAHMNANSLPQHLAEVEDDAMLDTAAHQWLKRDIFMRTHVVGQSSEWSQEWKSVSIP